MQHILMIGQGQLGSVLSQQLLNQGYPVTTVSRHAHQYDYRQQHDRPQHEDRPLSALSHHTAIQTDARYLEPHQLANERDSISHIYIIVSADQPTAEGYRESYYAISQRVCEIAPYLPCLQRVFFVSSTSIYGQNAAELIDIDTPIAAPDSKTAQWLFNTEQLLQDHLASRCCIIRPSGIYGLDRLRLIRMAKACLSGEIPYPTNNWTNRIMDTDLCQILLNLLSEPDPEPIYLATDHLSAPLYQVLGYILQQLGQAVPDVLLNAQQPTTGKRLINNIPSDWLRYPSYKEGYAMIIDHMNRQV